MANPKSGERETLERVYWLIATRNAAVITAVVLGITGALAAGALTPVVLGIQLAAIVMLYNNAAGYIFLKRKEAVLEYRQIRLLCFAQLLADVVIITLLVHTSGGILSPFVPIYLFGIVSVSLVMPESPVLSQLLTLTVIIFYEGLMLLESSGILPPVMITQQGQEIYQDGMFILYHSFVFPVFAIITAFLSTNLSSFLVRGRGALQQRITELNAVRKTLEETVSDAEKKTGEVAILYEISEQDAIPLPDFVSRLAEISRADTVEILPEAPEQTLKAEASYGLPAPGIPEAAVLTFPLQHQNKKIGNLKLVRYSKKEFSEDEKRILSIIATKLSEMLVDQQVEAQKISLETELKRKLKELQDFYKTAIDRELKMVELEKEIQRLKQTTA